MGALASHACKEPAAAHYTTYLLDKALEKLGERAPAFVGVHSRYDLGRWYRITEAWPLPWPLAWPLGRSTQG